MWHVCTYLCDRIMGIPSNKRIQEHTFYSGLSSNACSCKRALSRTHNTCHVNIGKHFETFLDALPLAAEKNKFYFI